MLSDSFAYATRSLTKRKLRSWLTIIGIFIGIAAVVSLISLGEGLRDAIELQFSALGADRLTIQARGGGFGPPGLGSAVKLTEDDLEVVQKSNHVAAAGGRLIKPVTVIYDGASATAFTASLPEARSDRAVVENFLSPEIESGRWISPDDKGKAVLGATTADEDNFDGVKPEVGKRISVGDKDFEIIGILKKEGALPIDGSVIMNEEDAREALNEPDEFSLIVARSDSIETVNFARESITKDLRKSRDVEERKEDFEVQTSQDVLETLGSVLGIVTGVLAGIAAISLLVGGIGIMNTMYTAVVERTKEIGIMKAIGATNGQILQIFLLEAGLLGLVGGVLGVLLGMGLSKIVEIAAVQALGPNLLQANTPLWLIISALLFSFLVGTLSGTFPARQAARLQPVEALR